MQLRKKILSHFLLIIYLLVVLFHSVSYSHTLEFGKTPVPESSHEHEESKTVHHGHQFHVGIFHFLEHLFENINHTNDLADEHLIVAQKTSTKKVVDYNNPVNVYLDGNSLVVSSVDAESLPDPPYHLFLLHRLKQPNTPLRAPPAVL